MESMSKHVDMKLRIEKDDNPPLNPHSFPHKFSFPSKKVHDSNAKFSWVLKLIEDPARVSLKSRKENIKSKFLNSKQKFSKHLLLNKKTKYNANNTEDNTTSPIVDQKSCNHSGKTAIGPWSSFDDIISVYDWSMNNVTYSVKPKSPYNLYFWDYYPDGREPKPQDIFVYTDLHDNKTGPFIISSCEYENMQGRIVAVWTPYGRDYFVIIGNITSYISAKIALAIFFRLSQQLSSTCLIDVDHMPLPETFSDIFDEVSKKLIPFTERNRFLVDILFEEELLNDRGCRFIDVIAKDLFDSGIFGEPVLTARNDRSNSFVLRCLDVVAPKLNDRLKYADNSPRMDYKPSLNNFLCRTNNSKRQYNDKYFVDLILEIINTEISYLTKQKRLMEDFYYPAMVRLELTDFIRPDYASRCMPSPQPIVEISERLLHSLGIPNNIQKLDLDSPYIPSLKALCTQFNYMFESDSFSMLDVYRKSILDYECSKPFFSEDTGKNEKFFSTCRNTYTLKYNEKIDVESLRIEPTQRVGRYSVMFESIADALDPNHESYELVYKTAYLARSFSERLNYDDEISCNAKANVAFCINLKLDIPVFDLNSWYVTEINVVQINFTPSSFPLYTSNGRTLLLFSSCLIVLNRNIPQWKNDPRLHPNPYFCSLDLPDLEILNCSDNDFIIYNNDGAYHRFRAENEEQKLKFLKEFKRHCFLSRSKLRDGVPYDAYCWVLDGKEVYYRIIELEALRFELAYGEPDRALGLFLHAASDDDINLDILKCYEIISLIDYNGPDNIHALHATCRDLLLTKHNHTNNKVNKDIFNSEFNPKNINMIKYNGINEFSEGLKSVISNYLKLSNILCFNTDVSSISRRMTIHMSNLIRACQISDKKNNKAMSILTKKSHISKYSMVSFATNIKKRIVGIKGRIRQTGSSVKKINEINNSSLLITSASKNNVSHAAISNASLDSLKSVTKHHLSTKNSFANVGNSISYINTQPKQNTYNTYKHVVQNVELLIELAEKANCINCEELYMALGNTALVDYLLQNLFEIGYLNDVSPEILNSLDALTIVSVLKGYLRDYFLRNPIITSKNDLDFLSERSGLSHDDKIKSLKIIFCTDAMVEDAKAKVIDFFMYHLQNVIKNSHINKISVSSLSSVVSPILFNKLLNDYESCSQFNFYMNFILNNINSIFGVMSVETIDTTNINKDPINEYDFKEACQSSININKITNPVESLLPENTGESEKLLKHVPVEVLISESQYVDNPYVKNTTEDRLCINTPIYSTPANSIIMQSSESKAKDNAVVINKKENVSTPDENIIDNCVSANSSIFKNANKLSIDTKNIERVINSDNDLTKNKSTQNVTDIKNDTLKVSNNCFSTSSDMGYSENTMILTSVWDDIMKNKIKNLEKVKSEDKKIGFLPPTPEDTSTYINYENIEFAVNENKLLETNAQNNSSTCEIKNNASSYRPDVSPEKANLLFAKEKPCDENSLNMDFTTANYLSLSFEESNVSHKNSSNSCNDLKLESNLLQCSDNKGYVHEQSDEELMRDKISDGNKECISVAINMDNKTEYGTLSSKLCDESSYKISIENDNFRCDNNSDHKSHDESDCGRSDQSSLYFNTITHTSHSTHKDKHFLSELIPNDCKELEPNAGDSSLSHETFTNDEIYSNISSNEALDDKELIDFKDINVSQMGIKLSLTGNNLNPLEPAPNNS